MHPSRHLYLQGDVYGITTMSSIALTTTSIGLECTTVA